MGALLADTMASTATPGLRHTLEVFLAAVVPGLERWDSESASAVTALPPPTPPPECEQLAGEPALPQPSLLVFGRYWQLALGESESHLWVLVGERTLACTGQYRTAKEVAASWIAAASERLREAWQQQRLSWQSRLPGMEESLAELEHGKAIEHGDLVLVNGSPPLLGYVLPERSRNVAICAHLGSPIQVPPSVLAVFERRGDGAWAMASRAHGVCMGPQPDMSGWTEASRAVALALYLRFAAVRFAANGKFHEQD